MYGRFLQPLLRFTAHADVKSWSVAMLFLHVLFVLAAVHHNVCMIFFDRAANLRLVPCANGASLLYMNALTNVSGRKTRAY